MSSDKSPIDGLLSSWAPFQEPKSDKEADTCQYFPSPRFQKFDIPMHDSAEETLLIRPLYRVPKEVDSYGPYRSSLFYDECLHEDMCPHLRLDPLLASRGDRCLNTSQV